MVRGRLGVEAGKAPHGACVAAAVTGRVRGPATRKAAGQPGWPEVVLLAGHSYIPMECFTPFIYIRMHVSAPLIR